MTSTAKSTNDLGIPPTVAVVPLVVAEVVAVEALEALLSSRKRKTTEMPVVRNKADHNACSTTANCDVMAHVM